METRVRNTTEKTMTFKQAFEKPASEQRAIIATINALTRSRCEAVLIESIGIEKTSSSRGSKTVVTIEFHRLDDEA